MNIHNLVTVAKSRITRCPSSSRSRGSVHRSTTIPFAGRSPNPRWSSPSAALVTLLAAGFLATSCQGGGEYKFDTVRFKIVGKVPPATGPQPNIHIDTHMKVSGMSGGTVETTKPYDIGIDYTDPTFTFAEVVFTKVTVTCADGTQDPGAAALKPPLRILGRPYETTNSVSGGRIVKTKLRVISGEIAGAITRDKPFTLRLEGHFTKNDGSRIPFNIKRDYDVIKDTSIRPWAEVMKDG